MIELDEFIEYLDRQDYSALTKKSYLAGLNDFINHGYDEVTIENLIKYKNELVAQGYKGSTVNARLHGVNCYLKFAGSPDRLKDIKIILEPFLTDNMTYRDYRLLIEGLLKDHNITWYIIVKLLATTGLRMQEALCVSYKDIRAGKCMVYGKGQKPRTIYFSDPFIETIYPYITEKKDEEKVIPYTDGYVRTYLIKLKDKYRLPCKCSPHEFRRFFAREVYARTKDMELVRSLLGHEQISMTSRYIRKGADQARELLAWSVTW